MSELKALHIPTRSGNSLLCYLKSEADKVIAEKDEKIDELEERIDEIQKATDSSWSKVNSMYDELRHQKYKRCLAMAMWCGATALFYGKAIPKVLNMDISDHRRQKVFCRLRHYEKWHKRWLKLADKLKELK